MFQEYDIVYTIEKIQNIPKGTKVTMLYIYENNKKYDVEFVDDGGELLNILTVDETDINKTL